MEHYGRDRNSGPDFVDKLVGGNGYRQGSVDALEYAYEEAIASLNAIEKYIDEVYGDDLQISLMQAFIPAKARMLKLKSLAEDIKDNNV